MTSIRSAIAVGRLSAAALLAVVLTLQSCVGMVPAIAKEPRNPENYPAIEIGSVDVNVRFRCGGKNHQYIGQPKHQAEALVAFLEGRLGPDDLLAAFEGAPPKVRDAIPGLLNDCAPAV